MLILARHGRTTANAQRLLLGRMDLPLDALGLRQAAAVGAALANGDIQPTRVIASPLGRAVETARAVAQACGIADIETDDRWLEVDYGDFDGEPLAEVPSEVWQHWRSDSAWTPPNGESLNHVGQRVRAACEDLMTAAEPVKGSETTGHADLMSASGEGSLIHAMVGSFGGSGWRWRNRAGLAA